MIKEFCDRCGKKIEKNRKKNISFDCQSCLGGLIGRLDMTVCLKCHQEIKEFAMKTIPYRGKVWAGIDKEFREGGVVKGGLNPDPTTPRPKSPRPQSKGK